MYAKYQHPDTLASVAQTTTAAEIVQAATVPASTVATAAATASKTAIAS